MVGRQIAILGEHPSGGTYLWLDGFGPERLAPPSAEWWQMNGVLEVCNNSKEVNLTLPSI